METYPHSDLIIREFLLARDYCRLWIDHIDLEEVGRNRIHVVEALFLCRKSADRLVFKIFLLIHVFFSRCFSASNFANLTFKLEIYSICITRAVLRCTSPPNNINFEPISLGSFN